MCMYICEKTLCLYSGDGELIIIIMIIIMVLLDRKTASSSRNRNSPILISGRMYVEI